MWRMTSIHGPLGAVVAKWPLASVTMVELGHLASRIRTLADLVAMKTSAPGRGASSGARTKPSIGSPSAGIFCAGAPAGAARAIAGFAGSVGEDFSGAAA